MRKILIPISKKDNQVDQKDWRLKLIYINLSLFFYKEDV